MAIASALANNLCYLYTWTEIIPIWVSAVRKGYLTLA